MRGLGEQEITCFLESAVHSRSLVHRWLFNAGIVTIKPPIRAPLLFSSINTCFKGVLKPSTSQCDSDQVPAGPPLLIPAGLTLDYKQSAVSPTPLEFPLVFLLRFLS